MTYYLLFFHFLSIQKFIQFEKINPIKKKNRIFTIESLKKKVNLKNLKINLMFLVGGGTELGSEHLRGAQ